MPAERSGRATFLPGLLVVFVLLYLVFGTMPRGFSIGRHHLWRAVTFLFPDNVKGTATASGSSIGNYTMHPDLCSSGERRMYFGVGFGEFDNAGDGGRIVLPVSDQPHIAINAPGKDYAVEFYKDECSTWDIDLHRTGSTYNRIWAMAGHARFDCFHPDTGAHVTGNLSFWSCH